MKEPVVFDLDEESRKSKVDEFIDWVYREYGDDMYQFFKCNYDGILENKLQQPYGEFPRGMKLSKVLMKEFGLDAEDVRQKLSMLIQSNKVTGTLCLSIHPLDYLSASENNHGWRSCHALDGEYRTGNISYMLDDCTIIAYLRSKDPVKLPRFPQDVPWNDKKWRVYLHVDRKNQIVYAGRQYPFHTDRGLELISEMIRDLNYFETEEQRQAALNRAREALYEPNMSWEYFKNRYIVKHKFHHWGLKGEMNLNGENVYFAETKFIVSAGHHHDGVKIVPAKNYIRNTDRAMNFNDVIQSHTYSPWIMTYNYEYNNEHLPAAVEHMLFVGAPVPCVCCNNRDVADSDIMVCATCRDQEEIGECEECGAEYPLSELWWDNNLNQYLCFNCYRKLNNSAPVHTDMVEADMLWH